MTEPASHTTLGTPPIETPSITIRQTRPSTGVPGGVLLDGARLERSIGSLTIAERWALRSHDGSTGMAYRLHERPTPRALVRLRSLAGQGLSHCVPIESVIEDSARRIWLVAPYLGESRGVLTLAAALQRRGGRLPVLEVASAVEQLRDAMSAIRVAGVRHDNITLNQIIICPHGRLHIELAGVSSVLETPVDTPVSTSAADDAAVAQIAAQLLTGVQNATAETMAAAFKRRERRGVVSWVMAKLG